MFPFSVLCLSRNMNDSINHTSQNVFLSTQRPNMCDASNGGFMKYLEHRSVAVRHQNLIVKNGSAVSCCFNLDFREDLRILAAIED
jgi:hypothetical protein